MSDHRSRNPRLNTFFDRAHTPPSPCQMKRKNLNDSDELELSQDVPIGSNIKRHCSNEQGPLYRHLSTTNAFISTSEDDLNDFWTDFEKPKAHGGAGGSINSHCLMSLTELGEDDLLGVLDNKTVDTDSENLPNMVEVQTNSSFNDLYSSEEGAFLGTASKEEPPSSVLRACDAESRDNDVFDPSLLHSSPYSDSHLTANGSEITPLQSEADWDIMGDPKPYPPPWTIGSYDTEGDQDEHPPARPPNLPATWPEMASWATRIPSSYGLGSKLLRPFKTFINLRELVACKAELFPHQPDAIFEVFARVSQSSRDNISARQHFHFRDLLIQSPPHLHGILADYEIGKEIDQAASEFLESKMPFPGIKCYCRCKLQSAPLSLTGWSVVVLAIRPSLWKEILTVVDRLGRTDLNAPIRYM